MNYYKKNAKEYIKKTFDVDMSSSYKEFLSYIPKGGKILDVGFGSGRDSLYFKKNGYDVLGIDVVDEFIEHGKELALNVKKEDILSITYKDEFDGIYCSASLLHLNREELILALKKIKDALKKDGVIYLSFKEGEFLGIRDDRYYQDMTLENMKGILSLSSLSLISYSRNEDKLNRGNTWISFIVKE